MLRLRGRKTEVWILVVPPLTLDKACQLSLMMRLLSCPHTLMDLSTAFRCPRTGGCQPRPLNPQSSDSLSTPNSQTPGISPVPSEGSILQHLQQGDISQVIKSNMLWKCHQCDQTRTFCYKWPAGIKVFLNVVDQRRMEAVKSRNLSKQSRNLDLWRSSPLVPTALTSPLNVFWYLVSNNLMKWSESCSVVSKSLRHHGLHRPWNSPGQNTGVGSLSLLQGIFPSQGSNPGLPHCRQILYQLSHKGSPNLDLRGGTRIWTGDLLICNQMLYHWAILPTGIYLKRVSVATHLAVSSRINKESISKRLRGNRIFRKGTFNAWTCVRMEVSTAPSPTAPCGSGF